MAELSELTYKNPKFLQIEDLLHKKEATFSQILLKLIDQSGKKDADIYKNAHVDRKLFSRIRTNNEYAPSKATAIAFAFALELELDEAIDLIGRAGYTLTQSNARDLIVQYFLTQKNYNLIESGPFCL